MSGEATAEPREVESWHRGLVADWWAEFNHGGPEIDYFGALVAAGQPALDAGCGAGRLLLPWLRSGYDVDGCDASEDMLGRLRRAAEAEGLAPTLYCQPLHALASGRRYQTIVVCGAFGLGTSRKQDAEALVRLRDALLPGGQLLLDNAAPYASPELWSRWTAEGRARLPEEWPVDGPRFQERHAEDGSRYTTVSRRLELDPLDQSVLLEIRAEREREGQIEREEHRLRMRMYFRDELLLMLESAGFTEIVVEGGYERRAPTADDEFLVYHARV